MFLANAVRQRLYRQFSPAAVILTYHRIVDLEQNTYALAVSPSNFATHMEYLEKRFRVLRLDDLGEAVRSGKIPRRAVAITFDDGYIDLLQNACPVLERVGLPATVFVPSGHMGSQREFWWDELERVILLPKKLPGTLSLRVEDQNLTWSIASSEEKEKTFWQVYKVLKPLRSDRRLQVLDQLFEWAGVKETSRPNYRIMNRAELIELTKGGLIQLGAHTVTHSALAGLSESVQRSEIIGGRKALIEAFGLPVSTFAYPYGEAEDFSWNSAEIVKETGFSLGCTMVAGRVQAGDDLYQLHRCAVLDWELPSFIGELEKFFRR
jgi:peptidoglycan/xylan/chitin deacetylase (PgdA/CDA1 family)